MLDTGGEGAGGEEEGEAEDNERLAGMGEADRRECLGVGAEEGGAEEEEAHVHQRHEDEAFQTLKEEAEPKGGV